MLRHLFSIHASVADIPRDTGVALSLIGYCLEKCGTAGTRAAENKTHFARFQDAR